MEPQIHWRVPGPLGAQNKLPKLISIIVKDPSAVFSVWTVKDFQFQVALTPGRQLGNVCQGKYKNQGDLVEIFFFKCTNLKALLTCISSVKLYHPIHLPFIKIIQKTTLRRFGMRKLSVLACFCIIRPGPALLVSWPHPRRIRRREKQFQAIKSQIIWNQIYRIII